MTKISMLALSLSVAVGLSACYPTSKSATTPALVLISDATLTSGLDLTVVDKEVRAQDNFLDMLTVHG